MQEQDPEAARQARTAHIVLSGNRKHRDWKGLVQCVSRWSRRKELALAQVMKEVTQAKFWHHWEKEKKPEHIIQKKWAAATTKECFRKGLASTVGNVTKVWIQKERECKSSEILASHLEGGEEQLNLRSGGELANVSAELMGSRHMGQVFAGNKNLLSLADRMEEEDDEDDEPPIAPEDDEGDDERPRSRGIRPVGGGGKPVVPAKRKASPGDDYDRDDAGTVKGKTTKAKKQKPDILAIADLPPVAKVPGVLFKVQASFEQAVETKLTAWYVDVPGNPHKNTLATKFLADAEPWKDHEKFKRLPLGEVADTVVKCANALVNFKNNVTVWSLPLEVTPKILEFDELCSAFDVALEDMNAYWDAVKQQSELKEADQDSAESKAKSRLKNFKDRLYQTLIRQHMPHAAARVICI